MIKSCPTPCRTAGVLDQIDPGLIRILPHPLPGHNTFEREKFGRRLFGDEVPPNRPTDLDGLVRALASNEPGEVAHARELLLNLGTDSVPPLMRGLETADEVAGVEIMDLLRQITGQELGFNAGRWLAWWRQLRKRGEE